MRYIVWVVYLFLCIKANFFRVLASKSKTEINKSIYKMSVYEMMISLIVYLILCLFNIGKSMSVPFVIISFIIYAILVLFSNGAGTFAGEYDLAYTYMECNFNNDTNSMLEKLNLLNNGVVAHKFNKSDFIGHTEEYKIFEKTIPLLDENMKKLYERRNELNPRYVDWVKSMVSVVRETSINLLDELMYLNDEEKIKDYFQCFSASLYNFNTIVSISEDGSDGLIMIGLRNIDENEGNNESSEER